MKDVFLQSHYAHCNETCIQVLDEPEQKAATQNWMWVYMLDGNSDGPQMVLFQYQRTRGCNPVCLKPGKISPPVS